jgi:hypothetical protein
MNVNFTTAGAEHCYNFYVMKRTESYFFKRCSGLLISFIFLPEQSDSEAVDSLIPCGEFHIGEYVNQIRPGCVPWHRTHRTKPTFLLFYYLGCLIIRDLHDAEGSARPLLVYCCVSGAVVTVFIKKFIFK